MKEVLAFLQDNSIFYLATVEQGRPRVRPFGFAMEYEGKLYFSTSNRKQVCRQLSENPYFEISAAAKTGEWLRLRGKAVFNTNRQTKQAALAAMPMLSNLYSVDDAIFELFYVDEAEATFYDMQGPVRTVKL